MTGQLQMSDRDERLHQDTNGVRDGLDALGKDYTIQGQAEHDGDVSLV
jgi:hypothetical protein